MEPEANYLPFTGKQINQMSQQERLKFISDLRQARNSLSISQQDLADFIGVSRGTIVNFEAGKSVPHDRTLKAIARVLDLSQPPKDGETEKYLSLLGPLLDQLNDDNKREAFEDFVQVITHLLVKQRDEGEGKTRALEELG